MRISSARIIDGVQDAAFAGVVDIASGSVSAVERRGAAGDGEYTVLPGLIDAHTHLSLSCEAFEAWRNERSHASYAVECLRNGGIHLDHGETTVRDMGGIADVVLRVRDAIDSGIVEGPTVYSAGQWLNVTGGHGDCYGCPADDAQGFTQAARALQHAGADFFKVMATAGALSEEGKDPDTVEVTEEELDALFGVARRSGRGVAVHSHSNAATLMAARREAVSVEHGTWLSDEAIEAMIEHGTVLVPTLTIYQTMAPRHGGAPLRGEAQAELMDRVMDAKMPWLEKAVRAGVRVAAGTDSGAPATPHGSVAHEIDVLTRAGMSNMQAIQAGTRVSGELVTGGARGVLAEGKAADVLIVRGDPLADIHALKNVVAVIKDGAVVRGSLPDELVN